MKYIFEVCIKPGHRAEEYADAWLKASRIIQRAPGALGTELHRKLDDPYTLIAIAYWKSKDQRDAMEASPNQQVKDIIESAASICDIRLIGEFADPEWVVTPTECD